MDTVQEAAIITTAAPIKPRKFPLNWYQLCLAGILLLSTCLNFLLLDPNYYTNQYYAAATRSMLQNWHNFFFNSFDPGGYITVDKPPVALWFQTISAWIFGYNGITLLLPSILAGVGSVALLYSIVKRAFGQIAGLAAALVLAITPIFVVMARHNNPEGLLIFFMLLGAWGISRATEKGQLGWLLFSVAMIGVAFNIKMLEAFIVLPAFYLTYFLLTPIKWWKRLLHLTLATVVLAIVSLSWAVIVDLTPTDQRPFIGSSGTNSVMSLIINYNGLNRIEGQNNGGGGNRNANPFGGFPQNPGNANGTQTVPGFTGNNPQNGGSQPAARTGRNTGDTVLGGGFPPAGNQVGFPGGGGGPGGGVIAGRAGPFRMFDQSLAGEAGWLLPLALLGIVFVGIQSWRRIPAGAERRKRYQALMIWGGWLLTFMVVFSMAEGIFHSYYLVLLSPGIAALSGISIEGLWHAYKKANWQKWFLPLALVITTIFQLEILSQFSDWNRTLAMIISTLELVCAVALLAVPPLFNPKTYKWAVWVSVVGFLGLCLAPAAWAIHAIFNKSFNNETLPTAVPAGATATRGFGFNQSANKTVLNNLLDNWNFWLTFLIAGLLLLVVLSIIVRIIRRTKFGRILVLSSAIIVLMLGVSMTLTVLPKAAEANSNRQISSGLIGNPQTILNANDKLLAFLQANKNGNTYLLATTSSNNAAPIIIKTGQAVMPLGGFMGSDQVVNGTQFAQMVKNKVVRYVLLDGGGGGFSRGGNQSATGWVQQSCKLVDSNLWSGGNNQNSRSGNQFGASGQLYDCAAQQ